MQLEGCADMSNATKRPVKRFAQEPPAVAGCRWIPLTKGVFALVDEEDFGKVSQYNWTALKSPRTHYAYFRRARAVVYLHRFIMDAPNGTQVDHQDGNGLNCRRNNMRVCSCRNNHQNIRKTGKLTSSQFKGVVWDKSRAKWAARVKTGGVTYFLGRFDSEEDAAHAYDTSAIRMFGEFARLNFEVTS